MRILVIEDILASRLVVRRTLVLAGHDVLLAETGEEGLEQAVTATPDAIILDLGLPDIDGLEVCRALRAAGDRAPILILSAHDMVEDRVEGLDAGVDEYLVKPFDPGELRARLEAITRRRLERFEGPSLRFADLELEPGAHDVRVAGHSIKLTPTEYQLLELFMLNPLRVLRPELNYERIWGDDFGMAGNSLRVYVSASCAAR